MAHLDPQVLPVPSAQLVLGQQELQVPLVPLDPLAPLDLLVFLALSVLLDPQVYLVPPVPLEPQEPMVLQLQAVMTKMSAW